METIKRLLGERPAVREILLTALAVLFGIEMMRYFVSGMTWILGDRFSIGAFQLGGIAIVIFGMAFLAGPLRRVFDNNRSLVITAAGVAVMRLLAQIQYGEPIVNMAATAIGIAFFGMFLSVCLDNAKLTGKSALSHLAIGLLLGFLLDTALNGLFGSYDYIYQGGIIPLITAIVLVSAELLLLLGYNPTTANEKPANAGTLPWLAIGLFFFLEMVVFSNIARLAAVTGWTLPIAFTTILIGQIIGLFLAAWLLSSEKAPLKIAALLSSLLLILAAVFSDSGPAVAVAATTLIGQLSIGLLMAGIINSIGGHSPGRSYKTSTVVNDFSMILFVVFVLAYYAVYQISLPYSNTILEIVAAVLLAILAIASFRSYGGLPKARVNLYMAPVISLVLLVAPLVSFIGWHNTEATGTDSDTITVMCYNLHNGFDTDGELGLEALAAMIEESNADIVALQEISRGWLISGGVDMLSWLSQRLDMPYVSGPTAGPLWGNAILSRYEITDYDTYELPHDDLCIERGFTAATIAVGGTDLQVIATHLHHVEEDSEIRQAQVPVILEYWNDAPNTIIMGDFNAWPDSPEMEMMYQAGLTDTLADQPEVLTFSSDGLYERIDYIWLSPDIQLLDCYVPFSQASDHLAVVAVINIG